jgi:hypothetical protein
MERRCRASEETMMKKRMTIEMMMMRTTVVSLSPLFQSSVSLMALRCTSPLAVDPAESGGRQVCAVELDRRIGDELRVVGKLIRGNARFRKPLLWRRPADSDPGNQLIEVSTSSLFSSSPQSFAAKRRHHFAVGIQTGDVVVVGVGNHIAAVVPPEKRSCRAASVSNTRPESG